MSPFLQNENRMASYFTSPKELRGKEIATGVTMRPLPGRHLMLSYLEFAPGAEVPTHAHPHEQGGILIEGRLEMWIGEERRIMEPGDMYMIAGGVPHGGRPLGGRAVVLDAFYPLREEYLEP
jgi:quercetin dioxygenase-like cupin family protein